MQSSHCFLLRAFALWVCVVMLGLATTSQAVTVHTWVDSDGVRHFADAPPADQVPSNEITINDSAPPNPVGDDYYSIDNQWQRLRAEREARAALDLERQRNEELPRDDYGSPPPEPARHNYYPNYYPNYYGFPQPYGAPFLSDERGPPSPRNAFVNKAPPVWPRDR